MSVYKLSASGGLKTGRTTYVSMLAGNPTFIPAAMELISTVNVGAGGSTSVTFSSIPEGYKHLQVRMVTKAVGSGAFQFFCNYNSDSAGNYSSHTFVTNGSSTFSSTRSTGYIGFIPAGNFGATVLDILDFASVNKYKTSRSLSGAHADVTEFQLVSMNWRNNAAITSLTLYPEVGITMASGSRFSLYGIKG